MNECMNCWKNFKDKNGLCPVCDKKKIESLSKNLVDPIENTLQKEKSLCKSPCCADCFFWEYACHASPEWAGDLEIKIGICRRYPPTTKPNKKGDESSQWPITQDHRWCGEYKNKGISNG